MDYSPFFAELLRLVVSPNHCLQFQYKKNTPKYAALDAAIRSGNKWGKCLGGCANINKEPRTHCKTNVV